MYVWVHFVACCVIGLGLHKPPKSNVPVCGREIVLGLLFAAGE